MACRSTIECSALVRIAWRDDRACFRILGRHGRHRVHPLFGAFLAGVCFPRVPAWQQLIRNRLDVILSLILLPLFFALTGLRTRLDLLNDTATWLWTGLILLLATAGKMGGAILGARLTGQDWRFSFALGALFNTRGLVELIVLNIAYNAHVFSPTLFTMLVVMALVTTAITVPILDRLKIGTASTQHIFEESL
jgi:Kef-type K+ transport system membrane component KefB